MNFIQRKSEAVAPRTSIVQSHLADQKTSSLSFRRSALSVNDCESNLIPPHHPGLGTVQPRHYPQPTRSMSETTEYTHTYIHKSLLNRTSENTEHYRFSFIVILSYCCQLWMLAPELSQQ